MSNIHSILVVLEVIRDERNIRAILSRGKDIGLRYYDHTDGMVYKSSPILNVDSALAKIINYNFDADGCGPSVYVNCDYGGFLLWCYQGECNNLEVQIGVFDSPKEKDGSFDFAYYIRLLLDLCDDFVILSLKTETIP